MPPPSWWIEWPNGPLRVGVLFLVALSLVAALAQYPGIVRERGEQATESSELSYADREIAGGNSVLGDQQVAYQARGRIPRDGTYRVDVGPGYEGETDLTAPYVANYLEYFLMPRRPADDAPWIICYGCDLGSYGEDTTVVWESSEGISIARRGP